jgi:hypothetical protein
MPYYPNVPAPTQRINDSQPQIQQNFQAIQTGFSVDHVPFGTVGVTEGKHNKVTLRNLAAPAFAAGEVGLYNNGIELYVKKAAGVGVPMTRKVFTVGTNGYTYLPSGLVMKFGVTQSILSNLYPGPAMASRAIIDLNAVGPAYTQTPFVSATGSYTNTITPPIPVGTTQENTCVVYQVEPNLLVVATYLNLKQVSWFAIGPV